MTESTEIVIAWTDTNANIYYRTANGAQAKKWTLQTISGITLSGTGLGNTIEWGHKAFLRSYYLSISLARSIDYNRRGSRAYSILIYEAEYPPLGKSINT